MATEYKINVPLNVSNNELRNSITQNLASAPTGIAGLTYYDTVLHALYVYNGATWVPADATKASNIPNSALTNSALTVGSTAIALGATATTLAGLTSVTSTTFVGALSGNASTASNATTATALQTARTIGLSGVTATAQSFNGTANITIPITAVPASVLTGTMTSSFISNFATTVYGYSISSLAAAAANVSMGGYLINNVGTGVAGTDAVNVNQLNAAVQSAASGIDPKEAVNAATTANITLSGAQTIDGVSVVAGNRVLVKNQTTASGNGIYIAASGAWTRSPDGVQGEMTSGAMMLVLAGTANAGTQWYLNTADPITVGTTSLTFVQFGAGAMYVAGNGLVLTGSSFSVGAGTGIVVSAGTTAVDTAVVSRKYATTLTTSATSYTVTHSLGTLDVIVSVQNVSTGDIEYAYVNAATTNTVTVGFSVAPAANTYRVTVHG